ncbi:MAG TPA: tripartite tricarboxylate transporter substrate-binding protein [Candidatus Limnocylindria bacterium]|nr:tripartite tricarboxylate transporter substrate-binding protein [Candidatus Limnocylindria bacterium]
MNYKFLNRVLCLGFVLALAGVSPLERTPAHAQDAGFFKGKTIRLIVGYSAGSAYDQYARLIAQHMAKHVPGNPEMIVQNMPGGGSLIAANYVFNVAKPDGLSLGMVGDGIYLDQLLGNKEVRYDVRKFAWVGSVDKRDSVLYMRADTPWKSVEDLYNPANAPRCGATGSADQTTIVTNAMQEALGTKVNIVRGYPGGPEIDLAIERGEIHCRGTGITGHFSREPSLTWHKNGFDRHIVQTGPKRDPRMPDTPTLIELMDKKKTPAMSRRVTQVLLGSESIGRPMMATPGLVADRLTTLRRAYAQAFEEPELISELKKRKLNFDPVTGEDIERIMRDILNQPAEVVERVKSLVR